MQTAFGQFVPPFVGIVVAIVVFVVGLSPWIIAVPIDFALTMLPFTFIEGKHADRKRLLGWIERRDNLYPTMLSSA